MRGLVRKDGIFDAHGVAVELLEENLHEIYAKPVAIHITRLLASEDSRRAARSITILDSG